MVARSAYTQLAYSPLVLAGTLVGLALLYLVPPLGVLAWPLHGNALAAGLAGAAWALQALSFVPTLALYGRTRWLGLALPVAGVLYAGMTFDSARRHHRREGALWKGRAGAGARSGLEVRSGRLGGWSPPMRHRLPPPRARSIPTCVARGGCPAAWVIRSWCG